MKYYLSSGIVFLLVTSAHLHSIAQSLNPEVIWAMPASARIKCVTDVPGRMTVEYGTTPALGMTSPAEWRDWPNTDVTRHYVNLLNLQPNTTYYYRVRITPAGGGSDLVSEIRTFRTFRPFSKVLPTVRYSSYIIGSDWSSGDTNAPYHEWNAQHYDLDIAYAFQNAPAVKAANPDAVIIRYDNITNNYATASREQNSHWLEWCDQRGISYERIAMHYAVDTKVTLSDPVGDRKFENIHVFGGTRVERFDMYGYKFPNVVGGWVEIGFALRYDIVYLNMTAFASGGYDGVWEYCNGVDEEGKPNSWAPLTIVEDTTVVNNQKFAQNGYVRFVPPKERTEWKRARYRLHTDWFEPWRKGFLVRFRVTQTGTSAPKFPSSNNIMNEDFVKTTEDGKEVIPGWDSSWETNPDNNGDPEYNPNPPTSGGLGVAKSARFKWWSRVWYYKPDILRFLCNVFDQYYQQWLTQAWLPYIFETYPGLDGWYCDNYTMNTTPGTPVEPTTQTFVEMGQWNRTQYAVGMGELMEQCSIALTSLGKVSCANNLIALSPGDRWDQTLINSEPHRLWMYFAPGIANREITTYWSVYHRDPNVLTTFSSFSTHVAEMAYRVARGNYHVPMYAYRAAVKAENNNEDWWDREKLIALALYLLVKDVSDEYLYMNAWHTNFIYGEFLTNLSGQNIYYIAGIPKQKAYYVDAAAYNFGMPITAVSPPYTQYVAYPNSWYPGIVPGLFIIYSTRQAPNYDSSGSFLGNTGIAIYFARRYTRALVVFRTGSGNTSIVDDRTMNEYTEFDLGGSYYRLRADGTLSTVPITRLNLRHQEAAILIPAGQASMPNIQLVISVDKANPKPLDVVTVTVALKNVGNEGASNVIAYLFYPGGVTYVQGSFRLNGVATADPDISSEIRITLPFIPHGATAVAEFQFVVKPRE